MLPNFICLGAQKAGTTTVSLLLEPHPDVFLARPRETRFFFDEARFLGGVRSYEREFFHGWNGQKAVGEKTPEYLVLPEVPGRIRETLGDSVRFIVCLRSPAQRAHSHFRHNYQQLVENRSFEAAIDAEKNRIREGGLRLALFGYLERGRYARQIKRYLQAFSKENLLFLIFESDIAGRQEELARTLFRFLDVDSDFAQDLPVSAGRPRIPKIEVCGNDTSLQRDGMDPLPVPAGSIVITRGAGKRQVIRNPSEAWLAYAKEFASNSPREKTLERSAEIEINRTVFKEEIEELASLIGRDLSHWVE